MIWALALGVLPAQRVYSRIPSVDWGFLVRHGQVTLVALIVLAFVGLGCFVWARHELGDFRQRVGRGFAILGDRSRLLWQVIVPQALSWVLRIASLFFFLKAFGVPATLHNALLALVVESLATLFPATPGGAGTKQGLTEYLFRGRGVSNTLLLAFSVGMNIATVLMNLLLGLAAIGLMARTLSFKRLRVASRADQAA